MQSGVAPLHARAYKNCIDAMLISSLYLYYCGLRLRCGRRPERGETVWQLAVALATDESSPSCPSALLIE